MVKLDVILILLARIIRMFSFGAVATVLFLHLQAIGMSTDEIGLLFSSTILGDLLMTIPLTTRADRWGRKRVLLFSAMLKIIAGSCFTLFKNPIILVIAATIGVITPTGGEIGPFMAVEQAALTAEIKKHDESATITKLYSIYNFLGYFAQAAGALSAGWIVAMSPEPSQGYQIIFIIFAVAAILKVLIYLNLSSQIEATIEIEEQKSAANKVDIEMTATKKSLESARDEDEENVEQTSGTTDSETAPLRGDSSQPSKKTTEEVSSEISPDSKFQRIALRITGLKRPETLRLVAIISLLFIMDAFAGGFVMQTVTVAWFKKQFNMSPEWLGALVSGMNVLAGISSLLVIPLARFGPLNVAVFSHLPSNVMLMFVPLMPTAESASGMILARSTLSQMDVPARQAFVAISVAQDERSAAGGITAIVRSIGTILAPFVWSPMMAAEPRTLLFGMPFILAGLIKIVYDLLLYFCFRRLDKGTTTS